MPEAAVSQGGPQIVSILQQRSLGDRDILQVVTMGQLSEGTLLELHRLAAQMKRLVMDSGDRVLEIRIGPVDEDAR
jgi:hypothetical protein